MPLLGGARGACRLRDDLLDAASGDADGLPGPRRPPERRRDRGADWISGEAGCADGELRKTAIRFEAAGLDQAEPVTLYLYVFRNRAAFERNRASVGPCAAAYVTDADTFEQVEQSPYVVAGQGPWAPEFEAALRRTLEVAAGTGG